MCYVDRYADYGENIVENYVSHGPLVFEVKATDVTMTVRGCGIYHQVGTT